MDDDEFERLYGPWRAVRPTEVAALRAALPRLDRGRRTWLRDAIVATLPDHPWLDVV